jgi:protein tyrosine phosphatase (PTP) superfamily phosphohydrolase (DUF442 family)
MTLKNVIRQASVFSVILFTTTFMTSCSHSKHKEGTSKVEKNVVIGKNLKANRFSNLYLSAQPSLEDLRDLKKQGFSTVINLRGPKEYDEKAERNLLKTQGVNYYNIPFYKNSKLTDEYITSVTKKVMKHRKEGKLLVHCSSGNRVGIWLGGHFYKDHGLSKDESIKMAKDLGLTKEAAEKKLRLFLDK